LRLTLQLLSFYNVCPLLQPRKAENRNTYKLVMIKFNVKESLEFL
jgi:hypothetical protein